VTTLAEQSALAVQVLCCADMADTVAASASSSMPKGDSAARYFPTPLSPSLTAAAAAAAAAVDDASSAATSSSMVGQE
jgi:hypothetical protein